MELMVVITPSFIRIRRISLAWMPAASDSSRTEQGNCTVTRSFRGAAVLEPVTTRR